MGLLAFNPPTNVTMGSLSPTPADLLNSNAQGFFYFSFKINTKTDNPVQSTYTYCYCVKDKPHDSCPATLLYYNSCGQHFKWSVALLDYKDDLCS